MALDTVVAFELVKPDGEVVKVTEQSDAELFFGLKVSYLLFILANLSSCSISTRVASTISYGIRMPTRQLANLLSGRGYSIYVESLSTTCSLGMILSISPIVD